MLLKLGRFRFLFRTNFHRLNIMKWWRFSIGYESKKYREWKKRLKESRNKKNKEEK